MKSLVFIVFFFLENAIVNEAFAQIESCFVNARMYGMGSISSVLSGFSNPAFSSFESQKQLELNYINRFGLKELSTYSVLFQYPNPWLNGAIHLSRYGFTEYNETRAALGVSRCLTKQWALGVRANYNRVHYSEKYSDKGIVTVDLGTVINLPENHCKIACVLYNSLQSGIHWGEDEKEQTLPVIFTLGGLYEVCKQFLVCGEVGKQTNEDVQVRLGIEYQPFRLLALRGGIQVSPFSPSLGMGIYLGNWTLHAGFSSSSHLGLQSACGLQFSF